MLYRSLFDKALVELGARDNSYHTSSHRVYLRVYTFYVTPLVNDNGETYDIIVCCPFCACKLLK